MIKKIIILIFLIGIIIPESKAQAIMKFNEFEPYLHQQNDTIYVINFWATWCRPCVKELPYFEQINKNYQNKKLKVILLSLDFAEDIETKLKPFIQRKNLQSEIIVMDDPDANTWIDKVDKNWSGAIPATLVYKGTKKVFHEGSLNYEQIENLINKVK
ncbi:MAG: TlpA family protein disulfide reductase [Bacteroidales bacterium]|nr:TlpA family protein disulfide reductase [Bacteroidales bacterium]